MWTTWIFKTDKKCLSCLSKSAGKIIVLRKIKIVKKVFLSGNQKHETDYLQCYDLSNNKTKKKKVNVQIANIEIH